MSATASAPTGLFVPLTVALLMGALLGLSPAFVHLARFSGGWQPTATPPRAGGVAGAAAPYPTPATEPQGTRGAAAATVGSAAIVLLAAMARRSARQEASRTRRGRAAPRAAVLRLEGSSTAPIVTAGTLVLAGSTGSSAAVAALAAGTTPVAGRGGGLVARRSLKSCYTLYFKRQKPYEDRHRRNIRNRAYNIFMKNKYKRAMKKVFNYCYGLEFLGKGPATVEEVVAEVKPELDNACLTVDEVCVQGILHRNTAARRKDRMCRAILRACIAKGMIEKPTDPFIPAFKVLEYEMPVCYKVREPRPWQLPGWKSPWMLKREFELWKQLKAEKAKTEA